MGARRRAVAVRLPLRSRGSQIGHYRALVSGGGGLRPMAGRLAPQVARRDWHGTSGADVRPDCVTLTKTEPSVPALLPDGDYEALFRQHFSGCVRLAALLGADDPQDVAQEAFVRLHRHASRLRDPQASLSYLRRTVVNLSRSRLRHLRVAARVLRSERAREHESAENSVVAVDERHRLVRALRSLPERQRAVLVLRYWLDLPQVEIAAALDIPVGTVKSSTSRALANLAEQLKDIP